MTGALRIAVWRSLSDEDRKAVLQLRAERQKRTGKRVELWQLLEELVDGEAKCRICGCTDLDCRGCIERTGEACQWIEPGLCSACVA